MLAEPSFIKKRYYRENHDFRLLPLDNSANRGRLDKLTNKVYVEDPENICILKKHGCFGKYEAKELHMASTSIPGDFVSIETVFSIGQSPAENKAHTENDEQEQNDSDDSSDVQDDIDQKYFLYLEEALFLSYGLGRFVIYSDNMPMTLADFWIFCKNQQINGKPFHDFYAAYHFYRSKGWVTKRGDNYGVDFVLYKMHPHQYHSTYGVYIMRDNQEFPADHSSVTWRHLAALCRILRSVKKSLILCQVKRKADTCPAIDDTPRLEDYTIEETNVTQWFTGHHFRETD